MGERRGVSWRGWVVATAAVWVALSVGGTWVLGAAWLGGEPAAASALERTYLKPVANLVDTALVPAWGAWRVLTGRLPGHDSYAVFAVANGLGWAFWLVGAWAAVLVARWCVRAKGVFAPESAPSAALRVVGEPDSGRRRFLVQGPVALGGLAGVVALPKSTLVDPWAIAVRRYAVAVRDLPEDLGGLRIVQVSDTHLGPRVPAWFVERAVGIALGLRPDVVALTGDYIHNGRAYIAMAVELFRPLTESGMPVVGVLGNHDWYGDGPEVRAAMEGIGIAMIDNGRVFLDARTRRISRGVPDGPALCIAGLGDLLEDVVDADAALAGVPEGMARVVLAHNPDTAEEPVVGGAEGWRHRVDLMLSGHTHGGQVRVPGFGTPIVPSRYGQKYAGGLVEGPWCRVVVSRGLGMSILPVRWGVPPEIVEVTLIRA